MRRYSNMSETYNSNENQNGCRSVLYLGIITYLIIKIKSSIKFRKTLQ